MVNAPIEMVQMTPLRTTGSSFSLIWMC